MTTEAIRLILGLIVAIGGLMAWPRFTRLPIFFGLLVASLLFALMVGIPIGDAMPVLQNGFGSLVGQIGLVVALGSVLGILLEKTGAMSIISQGILQLFGRQRPVLAIAVIGTMVGIPVFCDSGFIVLSRLLPELAAKSAASEGAMVLALSSSLLTTHTLVPPTPGPLAVAATLGMGSHLGLVIVLGILGSIPVVTVAYIYARRTGAKFEIAHKHESEPPTSTAGFLHAFIPLAVPVLLIGLASLTKLAGWSSVALDILGQPTLALLSGVLAALTLIRKDIHSRWPDRISDALRDAGIIILITGAGGAFGAVIKASELAPQLSAFVSQTSLHRVTFLIMAWLLAAVIKTAQGSSTSSMIITSSILAPLAAMAGYAEPLQLAALTIAIGGGSMAVSHANDSYFWVVSQFGGLSSKQAFRFYTPMTLLQGLTALGSSMFMYFLS